MKTSVELSFYPLQDEFKPAVKAFISDLQSYPNIKVEPGSISTRIFGEYREVMDVLTEAMEKTFDNPASIFVLKIMNLDRDKGYNA